MNFDTDPTRLKRQQILLHFLGFYSGSVDGVWSSKSIKAKNNFELSGTFTGGLPNQGLPFGPGDTLPYILSRDPKTGYVTHPDLTESKISEILELNQTDKTAVMDPVGTSLKVDGYLIGSNGSNLPTVIIDAPTPGKKHK
jgi:hypothetical protein